MPSFNYDNPNLQSLETLYQALATEGVFDAGITYNEGTLTVESSYATQGQVDNAVANATVGSLYAAKSAKIAEVGVMSETLMGEGVVTWSAGVMAPLSKNDADNYYTDFEYFSSRPEKLTASTPYVVFTNNGRAVSTSDINDIEALSEAAVDRLVYLYTASLNGDGSKGELTLVQEILAAPDQATLDAIIDTRV